MFWKVLFKMSFLSSLMFPCSQTASCKFLYTISFQMPFLGFASLHKLHPFPTPQLNVLLLHIHLFSVSWIADVRLFLLFFNGNSCFLPFSLSRPFPFFKTYVKAAFSMGVAPSKRKCSDNEFIVESRIHHWEELHDLGWDSTLFSINWA